jgi:hypothetical protein
MPASKLKSRLGTYVTSSVAGERVRAFIPPPLPPVPEVELSGLHQQLDRANQGLGRLNGMLLPDVRFLLYLYNAGGGQGEVSPLRGTTNMQCRQTA